MRILLATDGSDGAKNAVEALRHFPAPPRSTTLVLTAAPILRLGSSLRSTLELQRWIGERANEAVADTRKLLSDRFATVETRVVEGDARSVILQTAHEWKADLVVVGARGLGAVGEFLLGSVSTAVARHAKTAVLVVKGPLRRPRRIVVGVDGSDNALASARFVAGLSLDAPAVVHLLGVTEAFRYPAMAEFPDGALGASVTALDEELRRSIQEGVERAKRAFSAAVTVHTEVREGSPARELVRSSESADLLVVGARGVGAFERLLLGSVSEYTLRHAHCSVLVVHNS